jgi:hypothetical protein
MRDTSYPHRNNDHLDAVLETHDPIKETKLVGNIFIVHLKIVVVQEFHHRKEKSTVFLRALLQTFLVIVIQVMLSQLCKIM